MGNKNFFEAAIDDLNELIMGETFTAKKTKVIDNDDETESDDTESDERDERDEPRKRKRNPAVELPRTFIAAKKAGKTAGEQKPKQPKSDDNTDTDETAEEWKWKRWRFPNSSERP